jgi:hypothetical protein
MARLLNCCRHGNTMVRALCIVDLHIVFFSNIETLSVMEMQQWLPFVRLSSYLTFHTAVNNIIFLKSTYKLADIVAGSLTKYVVTH